MKRSLKIIYITLGFLFVGLGAAGAALPILPTTPFLLLAAFFFSKGSEKFDSWFKQTKLYKKYLEEFLANRTMLLKTKIKLVSFATLVLLFSAYTVKILIFRIFVAILIVYLYYYFIVRIKTISKDDKIEKSVLNND